MVIVLAAIVLMLLVKAFVVQVYRIPSASMEDTLLTGDRVLVNKLVYHVRGIGRGDIVVFSGQGSWGSTTGAPDPAPPSNPFLRFVDDVLADAGIYSTADVLHQAGHRPARRSRGVLHRRPGDGQRGPAGREVLPVPGRVPLGADVQRHRPARAAVGHGRQPGHLRRLARAHDQRAAERDHPREPGGRPGLPDHLAVLAVR